MTKGDIIDAVYKANLTKRATLVVFYLINRADKEMTCFPGVKTIAKECNMSSRTVQRALNDLVETSFLKKESRFHTQGGQRSNLFILMIAEKEDENTSNDTVTFDSYEKDVIENKREIVTDKLVTSKNIKMSENEQGLDKDSNRTGYIDDTGFEDVLKLYIKGRKTLGIDYCHGG